MMGMCDYCKPRSIATMHSDEFVLGIKEQDRFGCPFFRAKSMHHSSISNGYNLYTEDIRIRGMEFESRIQEYERFRRSLDCGYARSTEYFS